MTVRETFTPEDTGWIGWECESEPWVCYYGITSFFDVKLPTHGIFPKGVPTINLVLSDKPSKNAYHYSFPLQMDWGEEWEDLDLYVTLSDGAVEAVTISASFANWLREYPECCYLSVEIP